MSDNTAFMKAFVYSQLAGLSAAALVYYISSSGGAMSGAGSSGAPALTKE